MKARWLWRAGSFHRLRDTQQRREEAWMVFTQTREKGKKRKGESKEAGTAVSEPLHETRICACCWHNEKEGWLSCPSNAPKQVVKNFSVKRPLLTWIRIIQEPGAKGYINLRSRTTNQAQKVRQSQTPTHRSDTKPVLPFRQVADSFLLNVLNHATMDKLPSSLVAILPISKIKIIHSPSHIRNWHIKADQYKTITE